MWITEGGLEREVPVKNEKSVHCWERITYGTKRQELDNILNIIAEDGESLTEEQIQTIEEDNNLCSFNDDELVFKQDDNLDWFYSFDDIYDDQQFMLEKKGYDDLEKDWGIRRATNILRKNHALSQYDYDGVQDLEKLNRLYEDILDINA